MIKVYCINIDNISSENEEELMSYISQEKRDKIKRFHFMQDRRRSLCGEILARYMIVENEGIDNCEIQFARGEYGKPYLSGSNYNFNISHSGKWAVCAAVENLAIGVDVEEIREIDLSISDSFFTQNEIEQIKKRTGHEKYIYFFKLWTLKESYIKCVGKGLSLPLDSVEFKVTNNIIESNKNGYCFDSFEIDDKHMISLCSNERKKISLREFKECREITDMLIKIKRP